MHRYRSAALSAINSVRHIRTVRPKAPATALQNLNIAPIYEPSETAEDDHPGQSSTIKPTATTVSIQLPPVSVPLSEYADEPRNQPTAVEGYVPANDPAYHGWSEEEDRLLTQVMRETPEGRALQYNRIATLYFPHRRPRDLRMRWSTFLCPQRLHRDRTEREITQMRKKYGDALSVVDGRWCYVPKGWAQPEPSEKTLHFPPQTVAVAGTGQVLAADQPVAASVIKRPTHQSVGISSLDLAVQVLVEKEDRYRDTLLADRNKLKAVAEMKRNNEIAREEVEWSVEEDFVLREALESFGYQWDKIAKTLRMRKRTAEECRQRMEYLCRDDWTFLEKSANA